MLIELSALCGRTLRKQTGDLPYLLDSTPIALKGRGFDQWTGHNGRITGLKLHILMNHADQCPVAHSITDARVNDVDERHIVQPEKGATYVFDKGYCDYNWWAKLDEAGAYFVTRLKTNAAVEVVKHITPLNTKTPAKPSWQTNTSVSHTAKTAAAPTAATEKSCAASPSAVRAKSRWCQGVLAINILADFAP